MGPVMRLEDLTKRTKNAIIARIEATVRRYGDHAFRAVATRYLNTRREKAKLQKEIAEKETELSDLKKRGN